MTEKENVYRKMSFNRVKVIKAILDPRNISIGQVADVAGVQVETVLKYCGEEEFIKFVRDTKETIANTIWSVSQDNPRMLIGKVVAESEDQPLDPAAQT